jgi:hypothetical protein
MANFKVHTKFMLNDRMGSLDITAAKYHWPVQYPDSSVNNIKFSDDAGNLILELDPDVVAGIQLVDG